MANIAALVLGMLLCIPNSAEAGRPRPYHCAEKVRELQGLGMTCKLAPRTIPNGGRYLVLEQCGIRCEQGPAPLPTAPGFPQSRVVTVDRISEDQEMLDLRTATDAYIAMMQAKARQADAATAALQQERRRSAEAEEALAAFRRKQKEDEEAPKPKEDDEMTPSRARALYERYCPAPRDDLSGSLRCVQLKREMGEIP